MQNLVLQLEDGKVQLAQIMDHNHSELVTKLNSLERHVKALEASNTIQFHDHNHLQHQTMLATLFFPQLSSREEQVAQTYPDTYMWALKSRDELKNEKHENARAPNLLDWLEAGHGLYWVCGKAGSGKSTFMKYLSGHNRTQKAIEFWSGSAEAFIATYFLWSQGVVLQRSQEGFLRTILYHILSRHPRLITSYGPTISGGIPEWTKNRLLQTLFAVLSQNDVPIKLCIFIDGLDENVENPTELVELLCQISSQGNLKCLISSRPWAIFFNRLSSYPQIRLQELTKSDIIYFVAKRLMESPFSSLVNDEQKSAIVERLTEKAEGVFLWVSLATASVLEGFMNGDEYEELLSRIEELPAGLNDLYTAILARIEKRYQVQAMRFFKFLLLDAPHGYLVPSVLTFSLVDFGLRTPPRSCSFEGNVQTDALLRSCNVTFLQLQQRCGGLLHFEHDKFPMRREERMSAKFPERLHSLEEAEALRVQFLHRTVFDYFHELPQALDPLMDQSCNTWDPMVARADALICKIGIQKELRALPKGFYHGQNVKYLAQALLAVRCVELDSGTAQDALLMRLDSQGKMLFHFIGQQCGFVPDVHWCSLLSPHHGPVGSGNTKSLLELSALAGLVPTVKSKMLRLSKQDHTALLHCALNGLTYMRDGYYHPYTEKYLPVYYSYDCLASSGCNLSSQFRLKDLLSRVSLILALLKSGADPNAGLPCIVRSLNDVKSSSGLHTVREVSFHWKSAWTHLLNMITPNFYQFADTRAQNSHNVNTFPSWVNLLMKFIEKGADPQELVKDLEYVIELQPDMKPQPARRCNVRCTTFKFTFNFAAKPLPIIESYIQENDKGHALIEAIRERGGTRDVQFTSVKLEAPIEMRELFDELFDIEDPAVIGSGTSWDTSHGVLDPLASKILSLHQPIWDLPEEESFTKQDPCFTKIYPWCSSILDVWGILLGEKPRPPAFTTLREVLLVLDALQPETKLEPVVVNGRERRRNGNLKTACRDPKRGRLTTTYRDRSRGLLGDFMDLSILYPDLHSPEQNSRKRRA